MISIPRVLARHLRAVLRKAAPNGSTRTYKPPLSFQADQDGLQIRAHHDAVAVECRVPGSWPTEAFTLPMSALDDFEKGRHDQIELALQGKEHVQSRWLDGGVPQIRDYPLVDLSRLPRFPDEPKRLIPMESAQLQAFDDAAQITADESVRFALARLQLRGEKGEMVSSDGRQLLIQRGFTFPWKEDVLIPAVSFGACQELIEEGLVEIGKSDNHVSVRIGKWTFYLAIDKDSRYPRIENVIPTQSSKGTTFHIAPDDAAFVTNALPKLPGRDEDHEIVTVDLNGHVAIRARDEGQKAAELVLSRSESIGTPARFTTNREYLARAVKLGFSDFHVNSPDAPIVCRERQRIYLWVPLAKDLAIPPSEDVIRIESNDKAIARPAPIIERKTTPMPVHQTNGHQTNGNSEPVVGSERSLNIADLLNEAEEMRTVLQDASARLSRLINGLKQHRRQSKAMQAAMQSLRQLRLDS